MAMEYCKLDTGLCDSAMLQLLDSNGTVSYAVKFQFPPRIPTDSRKGEWDEGNLQGTEPTATFKTSGPREITLLITYIVDGGLWSTDRVAGIVKALRGYFARVRKTNSDRNLVALGKFWKIGGNAPMSFRLKGVDVKYSETMVVPKGDYKLAFPLRTDITIDLRLWTQGGPQATQKLPRLAKDETPDWY